MRIIFKMNSNKMKKYKMIKKIQIIIIIKYLKIIYKITIRMIEINNVQIYHLQFQKKNHRQ
jgi:hypothetical protein